jgi:hypothetical protein
MPNIDDDGGTGLGDQAALEAANEIATEAGFPGGKGSVENFQRPNALISGGQRQYQGVLQQWLYVPENYNQFLKMLPRSNWLNIEEADNWCAALQECIRYGAPIDWLVNRLVAHAAGVSGGESLMKWIGETISHTTFTTNYEQQKKKSFFKRGNNRNGPIAD